MSVKLTQVQYELLKEVAEENGFLEHELEEHFVSGKGDNYLGHILGVTLKDKTKKLELIVKLCPQNDNFRNALPIRNIFLKEIEMYERVLATFTTFQREIGVRNPFESYAKCYGKCETEKSECLVLENLIKQNYSLWNRKIPMNSKHISLVMSEFGKYHAVSFAMKKKRPDLFQDLAGFLMKPPTEFDKNNLLFFIKNTSETIQNAIQGNSLLENAYKKLMSGVQQFFTEELKKNEDKMVITHGDCWCNNMLFKYEDPSDKTKPTKVCLIDWQISRYALPVLDLAYFFCTSSSKDILDDYKKYLKIYHHSLSQNLKEMECDPDELLSYEDLEYLWKNNVKFGLLLGGFIFKILLIDKDNAADTQQNTNSTEDFYSQFVVTGNEEQIRQRILDVFNFMLENDFI